MTAFLRKQHGWIRHRHCLFEYAHRSVPRLFSAREGYRRFVTLGCYRIRLTFYDRYTDAKQEDSP